MNFYPTKVNRTFLSSVFIFLILILACSKDSELLKETILDNSNQPIDQDTTSSVEESEEKEIEEEEPIEEEAPIEDAIEDNTEKIVEPRTTIFTPINDAYLQSGKGYDDKIVRLEEGYRTSYLMFDLSKIDSIGGKVTETNLEFTIDTDDGHGTITVYKGDNKSWSETALTMSNAPKPQEQLGIIETNYTVGSTHEINLDTTNIEPNLLTLVMTHKNGNDLAFASKENPKRKGPRLVVSYEAPQEAEAIKEGVTYIEENQGGNDSDGESPNEDSTTSETPDSDEASSNDNDTDTDGEGFEQIDQEQTPAETGIEEPAPTPNSNNGEADAPVNEGPTAIAEATPTSGQVPLKVGFKGGKSVDDNAIVEYKWDFGDGSSSNEISPSHTYTKAGNFDAKLTVKDRQGIAHSDVVSIRVGESENEEPKSLPKASLNTGEAPLKVQFNGDDSTDDKEVSEYNWDFKDGSTSDQANPSHTFNKVGEYRVVLTVKDKEGLTNSRIVVIKVIEKKNEAPKSLPKASPSTGEAPLDVQFKGDNSTDDKEISEYFWDFKDGSSSNQANPSHTFTKAGEYKVVLTVKDREGLTNARIVVINVVEEKNEAPVAVAKGTPLTGNAPLNVRFNADSSSDDKGITSYFWDFKDGSTTTNRNPSHSFTEPGRYRVELSVKDAEGLKNATTIEVNVTEPSSGGSGGTGSGSSGNGGGSNSNPSNGVKASSFGFNSSNATSALKAAINSSHNVIIVDKQSSDWIVEPLHMKNIQNKTIIFENGVTLRAKSGAFRNSDRLLQFVNSSNIVLTGYGATLKMNKYENGGQQNHALSLIECSNITIKGFTIKDSGGDGLYISQYNHQNYCKNILIEDVVSTNNKRQGISVNAVDGLVVRNCTFSNTSGEQPSAGIDLEPDSRYERLENIVFDNCIVKDNYGPGILLAFTYLDGSSRPVDITFKNMRLSNNFSPSNPRDYKTEIDLGMSINNNRNPVKGSVVFDGLRVENSRWGAIYTKKTWEAYHVTVKNAVFKNISRGSNLPAIHIGLLSYGNRSYANMGGFTFENVLIDYDGVDPSLELYGPTNNNWDLRDLKGTIRVKSPRGIRLHDNMNKLNNSSSSVSLRILKD